MKKTLLKAITKALATLNSFILICGATINTETIPQAIIPYYIIGMLVCSAYIVIYFAYIKGVIFND